MLIMQKTIFIIPGFKEQVSHPRYRWMLTYYEESGFVVRQANITWNNRVMSDYVQEFSEYFRQHKTEENHVIGFSYGAMIAFISASGLAPDSLALCSLSPYFRQDLPHLKSSWKKEVGEMRIRDFEKYEAIKIAQSIKVPTVIFYGSVEGNKYPQLKVRCEEIVRYIAGARLVVVEGAPHDIDHPAYRDAIKDVWK